MAGRAIHGHAVLWDSPDDSLAAQPGLWGEASACGPAVAADGLAAIETKPRLSQPAADRVSYPYLLRGVKVDRINQVWSADITYVRLATGCVYLVAVIDWCSRYVVSWAVPMTRKVACCVEALEQALRQGQPEICNTNQGAQFTSRTFTERLHKGGIRISMDRRGGHWTTCLGSGCGGRLSRRRCICETIRACGTRAKG